MKHHIFLHERPVFTSAELDEHLASHGPVRARTREAFLGYYTKTGRVQRIRQGLYAVVPPGCDPGDHQVDSFHIAARLAPDAVVSHHAAVSFHGWAYNLWRHWTYTASKPVRGNDAACVRRRIHTNTCGHDKSNGTSATCRLATDWLSLVVPLAP